MMRAFVVLIVAGAILSACDTGPNLGIGLGFGPGGVSVSPNVSGKIGRVNVGASL